MAQVVDKPYLLDEAGLNVLLACLVEKVRNMTSGGSGGSISEEDMNQLLSNAKSYTDQKISEMADTSPEIIEALRQLSDLIQENPDAIDALSNALVESKAYTDEQIANLIDSSPAILSTLNQIKDLLNENPDLENVLLETIASKLTQEDLDPVIARVSNLESAMGDVQSVLEDVCGTITS